MNILVIGDLILDINYISFIERNAPEANIPIYNIKETQYILGGAANVANNLQKIGVNVELISVIGNDYFGEKIQEICNSQRIQNKLFIDNRKTTQKHRIFNGTRLSVRYDIEDIHDISDQITSQILEYISEKNDINAIIISDYNKGCITEIFCKSLIEYANSKNIYTFVDPKIKNYKKYIGCFCFKPNLNEAIKITNSVELDKIFEFIKNEIQCKNILITCANDGMYLNNITSHIENEEYINCLDVTGAGDIVLSVLVYCFIKYNDMYISSKIANYIAGKSVSVIGNYTTSLYEIERYYNKLTHEFSPKIEIPRVIYDNEISRLIQLQNKDIVFTNGCFDIIHSAHIKLLNFCKNKGDILIVGLNSDESIKRIKGSTRPINNLNERIDLLLSLNIVDYIVVFTEDTPYNIIKYIQPNIIVKGGDYKKEDIVGGEYSNEIIIFNYIQNKSTSSIIKIIQNNINI